MDKSKSKQYTLTTCDYCGKEFYCQNFRIEKYKHVFCNTECKAAYIISHRELNYTCDWCGKKFYRPPAYINKTKHFHSCSKECESYLRQQLMAGERNHQYGIKGSANATWKSDKRINSTGYILIRRQEHPYANSEGFIYEHRLVAEANLLTDENSVKIDGVRYLSKDFQVHHCNFNRSDNSVDNLRVMPAHIHMSYHSLLRMIKRFRPGDAMYESEKKRILDISKQYNLPIDIKEVLDSLDDE